MFKINRASGSHKYSVAMPSTKNTIRRDMSSQKSMLKRSLSDSNKLNKKITTEKLNSFKRLTKLNIRLMNTIRYLKLKLLNNLIKNQNVKLEQIAITNNLPKIPEYKPQSQQSILSLPTRKILTQEDMAKIFNAIMNGADLDIPKPENNILKNILYKNINNILLSINTDNYTLNDFQKDNNLLNNNLIDLDKIILRIKNEVINLKNINYIKYIEIATGLKQLFPTNTMIKSIILRALDRHNRQQYYKIPDDKLKDVVAIILLLIK